jgi:hypothetical protein
MKKEKQFTIQYQYNVGDYEKYYEWLYMMK